MQINRKELATILRAVDGVLLAKNTHPILDNILLDSDGVTLQLSATNLTSSIQAEIPFNSPLECVIHGKTLSKIVQAMSVDTITLEIKGKDLIVAGSGEFKLRTANVKEFPHLQNKDEGFHFRFNRMELLEALRLSGFMLEDENYSYGTQAYKGVACLTIASNMIESKFSLASTNDHALSLVEGLCEKTEGVDDGFVLFPRSVLSRLTSILALSDAETINITDSSNHIFIDIGNLTYSFLKSTADFKDISRPFLAEYPTSFTINSKNMRDALQRVQIIADAGLRRTLWSVQDGELTMSGVDATRGEGKESLPIKLKGEPFEIGFDLNYVLNVFTRTDDDVECQFSPFGTMKTFYTGTNLKGTFLVQSLNLSVIRGQNESVTTVTV